MAVWLLLIVGAVLLAAVVAVVSLVWVLSAQARPRPGGAIGPRNDAGVQGAHAHSQRTNIQHNIGDIGPGI